MSGCFGNSKEDDYFERQLYNHLSEKAYCEKHDIYYDECRTHNGGCPLCENEDPELQDYIYKRGLFGGDFDPGNPKIFKEV
jgi:hypothetical protein